eukprot:3575852-Pleurochrysis_carterae.AAC.2
MIIAEPRADQDLAFETFVRRLVPRECVEDLLGRAPTYYSEFMTRYQSNLVAWIELQRNKYRDMITVRMTHCTPKSALTTAIRVVTILMTAYQRLLGG